MHQVALSLYLRLGARVLLQLEAFLARLLLPLAAGKGGPGTGVSRQEAALEVHFLCLRRDLGLQSLRSLQLNSGMQQHPSSTTGSASSSQVILAHVS